MMTRSKSRAAGNVLFILLMAIALIGALTYAITGSGRGNTNLSRENTSLAVDQVISFGMDLHRAVDNMLRDGKSESSISFATSGLTGYGVPDTSPANEVFNIAGGGVSLPNVPSNINDGTQWEFMAQTRAPLTGEDANADLMLVLPNVSKTFCTAYNVKAGYSANASIPTDTGTCLYDSASRFDGSFADSGSANEMNSATFKTPAPFACVACDGPVYHAYYVLIER